MAALIQYEFNNKQQYESAGLPQLQDATHITVLGEKDGKYYVEVLYANLDDVPDNGLLAQKAIDPIPHQFLNYISLQEYEQSKQSEV